MFTGDQFADGGDVVRNVLNQKKIQASFFFTGNFYRNQQFKSLIHDLKKDRHYLGAHSDKHLLYNDWTKRDSLLVTKNEFDSDLLNNYRHMEKFGVQKKDAPYFIPPYEWYNATLVQWTKALGLQFINFTPGTRSTADYTYPEMGTQYRSSEEIYNSIIEYELKDPHGLNGFILLLHIGTDARRTDKFYNRLRELIEQLSRKGYRFVRVDQLLDVVR